MVSERTSNETILGSVVVFEVVIPSTSLSINAAQIHIKFDEKKLSLLRIEKNEKFFKYEIENDYENSLGWIKLAGGLPHPGIKENNLVLAKFYFQAKKTGNAYVSLSPTTVVLVNDGKATEASFAKGQKWWKITSN